jgi:hypothetical protein
MVLKEVIIGPRSKISTAQVRKVVLDHSVDVFKSRLAFQSFSVVHQNDKSRW